MNYKLIKYIFTVILLGFGLSEHCAPETDWCFSISMNSSYYFFFAGEIEDNELESGSVSGSGDGVFLCPDSDCDIIAAFYNDVCVGWTYPYFNGGYTVPVFMNDGNFTDYPNSGDIVEFRLYDHVTQSIFSAAIEDDPNDNDDIITNIPGVENLAFFLIDLIYDNGLLGLDNGIQLPEDITISEIYPNPFNSNTTINYSIPINSNLKINIYNLLGQSIETLYDNFQYAGFHSINWHANDISSGVYLVRLSMNEDVLTKKIILIK